MDEFPRAVVLVCSDFDGEPTGRFRNACSSGCSDVKAIEVCPWRPEPDWGKLWCDYSLGIRGLVCAGRYEFVRSLSREWWVRRLALVRGLSEDEIQKLINPKLYHQRKTRTVSSRSGPVCVGCGKPVKRADELCDACFNGAPIVNAGSMDDL